MSNFVKPQAPLYSNENDAYFYPLTTVDQIIMEDGRRLNSVINDSFVSMKLNYSVVGGAEEPANPTENMIWINTENEITKVVFRNAEPSNPIEGMVCIYTGAISNVSFDRIIVGGVGVDDVHPVNAKQYVDNVWVDKTAKSYQNGEWVDWILYLYNSGDTYDGITGGWDSSLSISKFNAYDLTHKDATFGNTSIIFDLTSAGDFIYIPITSGLIDLTDIKTIYVDYTIKAQCYGAFLGVSSSKTIASVNEPSLPAKVKFLENTSTLGKATASLDVSGVQTGKYYVVVWSYVGGSGDTRGCFEINSIRMEK